MRVSSKTRASRQAGLAARKFGCYTVFFTGTFYIDKSEGIIDGVNILIIS